VIYGGKMEVRFMPTRSSNFNTLGVTSLEETSKSQDRTLNSLNAETKLVFALNLARLIEEITDENSKRVLTVLLNQLAASLVSKERMH
jgi:hypothetical protein